MDNQELSPDQLDAMEGKAAPQELTPEQLDAMEKPDPALPAYQAAQQQVPPEKRLESMKYGAAAGLPPTVAEEHLDTLKATVDQKALSLTLRRSPGLAQYAQDPAKAPLWKDDAANLGPLEWALTGRWEWRPGNWHPSLVTGPALGHALRDADAEQHYIELANKQAMGQQLSPDESKELESLEAEHGQEKDYGAHNFVTKGLVGLAKMAPYISGDVVARVAGGTAGAFVGGLAGGAGGAAAGAPAAGVGAVPGAAVGGAGGTIAGLEGGQYLGSAVWNFYQNFGPQYRQLRKLTDQDGKPLLSDTEAREYAAAASAVSAGLMAGFGGKLLGKVPAVQRLLGKVGGDALAKALEQKTVPEALAALGKRYGTNLVHGALMMASQSAVNAGSREIARATHGQDPDWVGVAGESAKAAARAVEDMSVLAALGPGKDLLHDIGQAKRLQDGAMRLQAQVEAASKSKLLDRSPEEFEQAATAMQGGQPQHVYVSAEAWNRLAQDKKLDPAQLAEHVMEGGAKAYTEALATGGDLTIPAEKYLSKLSKTELAEALREDVRVDPDVPSIREAREHYEALLKDSEAPTPEGAKAEAMEKVRDDVFTKAVASGQDEKVADANARIWAAAFGFFGAQTGVDAHTAYTRAVDLQIHATGVEAEPGMAMAAQRQDQPGLAQGPEASRVALERWRGLSPEAKADELFRDHATGLLNEEAFKETPKPAGKQLAVFEFGNVKHLNDHPEHGGHEVADGVYRQVARELSKLHPEAYKLGGRLAAYVDSPQQAKALEAKLNAAVGDEDFRVVAATGKDMKEAGDAVNSAKDAMRAKGLYPDREKPTEAFLSRIPSMRFSDERAAPAMPEHLLTKAGAMSEKEAFERGYVEKGTGLLTAAGWHAIPRKRFVASIDLRGLKAINDVHGKAVGDLFLEHFGREATKTGGTDFDFAHRSGDEYLAQSDDKGKLEAFLGELRHALATEGRKLRANGLDAGIVVHFRHGIGEGEHAETLADRDLNRQRADEKAGKSNPDDGGAARGARADGEAARGEGRPARGDGRPQAYPEEDLDRLEQRKRAAQPRNLLVQHNLREDNLAHADELGGLAAPSLAVARKEHPLSGFGEVTLLADRELINPKSTPVFDADVYSPRYPDTHFQVKEEGYKALRSFLEPYAKRTEGYLEDLRDKVERDEPGDVIHSAYIRPALEVAWLEQVKGKKVEGSGRAEIRDAADKLVEELGKKEFEKWATAKVAEAQGERLITRMTASGNRRGIPYTLENILREVTGKIRGGENFNTGLGRVRAEGTRKFSSFKQIEGARDNIVSDAEFQKLKDENDKRFFALADEFKPFYNGYNSFIMLDDLANALGDSLKRGGSLQQELSYRFPKAPPELIQKLRDFGQAMLSMPTEYFEAKPQRAVGLGEFKAAVVPHDASESTHAILKKHGIQAFAYERGNEADRARATAEAAESHNILFQDDETGATFTLQKDGGRGYVTFGPPEGGKPRRFDIHLLESADRSTFAHESMHVFSEVMGDLARMPGASERIKSDYQTLLTFMGHESQEARDAAAKERRALSAVDPEERTPEQSRRLLELTAKEERVTHAWEQYLLEGKAPTVELAGVFARFKNWLTRVYRGLGGLRRQFRESFGEDLHLSDDVRQVFDRLLTGEDEVRKAEAAQAAQPLPEALRAMTPQEAQEYEATVQKARDQAEAELRGRLAKADRDANAEWAKAERARVTSEVEAQLDANPTMRTLRYLQEGKLGADAAPDVLLGSDGQPLKLDRKALVKEFGKDFMAAMPRGVTTGDGGVPADELAGLLGWDSGDAMVRALQASRPRAEVLREQVQQRMAELYPTLKDSPEQLAREAIDVAHNPAAARKVALEAKALRKALLDEATAQRGVLSPEGAELRATKAQHADEVAGLKEEAAGRERALKDSARFREATGNTIRRELRASTFNNEGLRDFAQATVEGKTVGELTRGDVGLPGAYLRAERRAANDAQRAAATGNLLGAIQAKEKQLLNMHLYREARDMRRTLERGFDFLRGTAKDTWRAALGKVDAAYRGGHDALLQAIGLQGVPQGQARPDAGALDALVTRATADAQVLDFDVQGLRDLVANPKPWAQLTAEEAQGVVDAVRNIRHVANNLNEVTLAGKKQSTDAFFAELAETASGRKPLEEPVSKTLAQKSLAGKLAHLARGADAALANMETFAAMLDGEGNREGAAHRLLVDERLKARAKAVELEKQVLEPLRKAWEAMPKEVAKLRDQVVDVDLPAPPGSRLKPQFTRDNLWMLFLNSGNEGNLQRLRDGNGISDAQREKALSLLTKPELTFLQSVLDTMESLRPELQRVHEARTGLPLKLVKASPVTVNGETYRGGYFPLRYDSRVSRQGSVQDASVVSALFSDGYTSAVAPASGHRQARVEKVQAPVDLHWGVVPAHLAQVIHDISYGDWVKQAGRLMLDERFKDLARTYLGPEYQAEFIPWLRDVANARADSAAGAGSAVLGEVGGFTRSKLAIGVMGLNVPSILAHLADPFTTRMSGVPLRNIASAYLKTMARGIPLAGGLIDPAEGIPLSKEMAYREAQFSDNLRKALVEMGPNGGKLREAINGIIFKAHEWSEHFTTTVAYRAAYEHAISSGKTQEQAVQFADDQVRRNFPSADLGDKSRVLRSKQGVLAALMFYGYANKQYQHLSRAAHEGPAKLAATALYMGMLGMGTAYLAGRGPDPDEDKKEWAVRKVLLDPLNTIPFLGTIAEQISGGKKVDMRTVPELAFAQDTLNRLQGALKRFEDGGDEGLDQKLLGLLQALAGGLGPVHQAKRTFGYLKDASNGQAQVRGPGDVAAGVIYGKEPGDRKPSNPLTGVQDAVSGD